MKIRYITLDCYGTLIDWRKGIVDNFKTFAKLEDAQNFDIFNSYVSLEAENERGYSTYRQVLARTFLDLAHQLKRSPSEKDALGFANSIVSWPAFDDSSSTLKVLGLKGYRRVILSNTDRILLQETIKQSKLEVDDFITAEDIKSYKPQKGHWLELLKRYNLKKDEVLHVAGSLYHDIIPASEMGFRTVWVNRYDEPEPENITPTFSVNSLSEVLTIL